MLQYWEYEEFVIHSFQDSLSGSALDWFMSLKAEDIPTWEDLSRKFTDQYRYCAEAPPTLLELSTKEMAQGQRFEEYATKWRAQAAKHIPPIIEVQQIQLFYSTLRGQYSANFTSAPPIAPSYPPHTPQYRPQPPTQPIYYSAPPPPPPSTVPSPVIHHYTPTPSQALQYQPPAPRISQPTQRAPPPQGQQGGATPSRPRKQYPNLPVPLSHIYQQIRDKIGTIAPGPSFDPTIQDQSKQEGKSEQGSPPPIVIEYVPAEAAIGFTGIDAPPAPFIIDILTREPYSDDKVPWTYEGGVGSLEQQFGVMGITRSGRLYESPTITDKGKTPAAGVEAAPEAPPIPPKEVTEEEAEAFMKIIKVPKGTPPDQIEETVSSIFSSTISFSDDELPSERCAHSRALHVVCKCNNHIVGRVMIDNGFALNVCPVTTLKHMNVDLNRVRPSETAVRAFDGSRREVNGEIDLLIEVGPCSFSVTFQVLDIPNAFSLLLGRPWIHSAGAVPSSLHLKLKFFVEERLSAPHSGPPASRTRIPDRSSEHYSSPGNQGANRQARGTQGPPGPGNKLQTTFWNSARSPEVRFSGRERLPASLRVLPGQQSPTEDDGPTIPRGAKGSPKLMQACTKNNRGSRDAKLHSERPNRAKPTPEAPSRSNESNEPDLAPCRDRSKRADPFFHGLQRLPTYGSLTRSRPSESRDSHGHFPDSFPLATRLGNIPFNLGELGSSIFIYMRSDAPCMPYNVPCLFLFIYHVHKLMNVHLMRGDDVGWGGRGPGSRPNHGTHGQALSGQPVSLHDSSEARAPLLSRN
ncbi:hypothetical protein CRG98_020245 [Punica granatum]|uniref:Retrotransposon gag domain-containing protein n=1 Tax=Punica granatum TaxID=22663 RepID=A0A2I0JST1_PUNGR|nr:hypothetical protein CRG98_020245 [Punica granatum]